MLSPRSQTNLVLEECNLLTIKGNVFSIKRHIGPKPKTCVRNDVALDLRPLHKIRIKLEIYGDTETCIP